MHDVKALVTLRNSLVDATVDLGSAVICPLSLGFALLPITKALAHELVARGDTSPGLVPDMAPGVANLAQKISQHAPVAYVSTEYFGGAGGQDALLWEIGNLVARRFDDTSGTEWPNSPVSRALRALGVQAGEGKGEFDTVGLNSHRSTERWASAYAPSVPK